ncbi:MAG TPA: hypothetical protein VF254_09375 [Gammaproteobacteria bacterium]
MSTMNVLSVVIMMLLATPGPAAGVKNCDLRELDRRFTAIAGADGLIREWRIRPEEDDSLSCYSEYLRRNDPGLAHLDRVELQRRIAERYRPLAPGGKSASVITIVTRELALAAPEKDLLPPPPPPPPPPVAEPGSPEYRRDGAAASPVEDTMNDVRPAALAIDFPARLEKGETAEFRLGISMNDNREALLRELGLDKGARIDSIQVTPWVRAKLVTNDNDAFDITPLQSEDILLLEENSVAEWAWWVRALKEGHYKLTAVVHYRIDVAGGSGTRFVETHHRDLEVFVGPAQAIGEFLGENWKLFATSLLFPLLLFYFNRKRGEKSGRPAAT